MGGVEDEEPPLKRVKPSEGEVRSATKDSSIIELAGSCRDLMARPLLSLKDEMIGSKGVIKKVEFVRIITKALYSLGYERSGAVLVEESGIPLHSSTVELFRKQVLNGDWDESIHTLEKIGQLDESTLKSAAFLILEQKFLEYLEKGNVPEALKTLRTEISPLRVDKDRVHELAGYIVSPSLCKSLGPAADEFDEQTSRSKLLQELQLLLPPTIMVPERRLEHLVEQALNVQRESCVFHNSHDTALSLFADHQCGNDQIPTKTLQVLQAHQDEVWFLQFSHDGRYLASSSHDCTSIIWEVRKRDGVLLRHRLAGHHKPVCFVAWSPDDRQLLTCGMEEVVRCWDVETGNCLHVYEKTGHGLISCGWFPDGRRLFTGVNDKSVCIWDVEGKEHDWWKGQRAVKMSDMLAMKDGKIISMNKETTILFYDREAKTEKLIIEDSPITSFTISRDENFLLTNLSSQEIHLWNIANEPKLMVKYKGHKRTRLDIRSCFGGSREAFVASGSEDSLVYLWHRGTGKLLEKLSGHSGAVNCVSWNPANPHMLASASDDRTVRIWGLSGIEFQQSNGCCSSNGISNHCNGNGVS